jgi:phosphohistidine phosphatase
VKRLLLIRHAKSSWDDPALSDHERPLAPRGTRAAERLRAHLEGSDLRPDLVLSSSSRRTRETLELLAPAFGNAERSIEDGLYGADGTELLERLRGVPDDVSTVALIGHNPGIEDLVLELAEEGTDLDRIREKFPTGALAVLGIDAPWRDLATGSARLLSFVSPRELG